MKYGLTIGGRTLSAIIMAAALVSLCMPALAVEDGQGTNVVKSLRVVTGGTLSLDGEAIKTWDDLSEYVGDISAETTARLAADLALTNSVIALNTATNALHTRVGTAEGAISAAEGDIDALEGTVDNATTGVGALNTRAIALETSTNAINTRTTALETSTGTLNTAVGALQTSTNALNTRATALETSTNVLNTAVVNLQNAKYTPGSKVIAQVTDVIPSGNAVVTITNSTAGALTLTADNPIAIGLEGQFITVRCLSPVAVVLPSDKSGLILEGGVSFTMKQNDVIQLICDGTKWSETHRADN